MIWNIRGTSGTGKTTLVRELMAYYKKTPVFIEGRSRPIAYKLTRTNSKPLAVIGSYEAVCGGCDTVPVRVTVYKMARYYHSKGYNVIFEGLLCSDELNHTKAFHTDGLPITVIGLEVPIEECLRRVNARRRAKKPEAEDVNPKNTIAKDKTVKKTMRLFQEAGMRAFWFDNKHALVFMKKELGLE